MNPNNFDLSQATLIYGVSNTPLFLLRKLQSDPVVRAISDTCSGAEILEAIRVSLLEEPRSPLEAVQPYAYLLALWFKPEIRHLQEASKIPAPHANWYPYMAEVLTETFSKVQTLTLQPPGQLPAPVVSIGSTGANNRIIMPFPH
jgi:hypothetical protein